VTQQLTLPEGFAYPALNRTIAAQDTMYDGRDEHYLVVGASALACIRAALRGKAPSRILDLPCGYGRVTRFLRAAFPRAAITACDLERDGVDFCAATFGAEPIYSTEDLARLQLPRRFDLIFVGSLITHLSVAQTQALLDRLGAALAPGGVIVASAHGPSIADGLREWGYGIEKPDAARILRDFGETGYGHCGYGGGAGYGISLSDRLFWAQFFAKGRLELVSYDAQGWDQHQDILVLRRRDVIARLRARRRLAELRDAEALLAVRRAASAHDAQLAAFDGAAYLRRNPDVAAAVSAADFSSAFAHYWERGRFEGRSGAPSTENEPN
jgi:SAM-dependent methyltransferase